MPVAPDVSPFRQFLLKLHSRCNLACDYCYVYEHADQSWRERPRVMAPETVAAAAARIGDHLRTWRPAEAAVVLHGGEPLLAGAEVVRGVVRTVRASAGGTTRLEFAVQTNGLLLDPPMLDMLAEEQVGVGVSLDGPRAVNDRHRRFAHGGGSYDRVAAGLHRLGQDRYRHLYRGLLCTIDVREDPIEVYEGLLAFDPPRIDLLLPHGNWTTPPPLRTADASSTPYADWLIPIFDRWYRSPSYRTDVRLFSSIMSLLVGGVSRAESVGLTPIDYVTIETDGTIEQSDALKTVGEGAAATGLTVFDNSLDEALRHPAIRAQRDGVSALCATCRGCRLVQICGGGLYAHRHRAENGFANPTVYCADQQKLIDHISSRISPDLNRARLASARSS
ncbi:FxsB family cyclophane-forming radical SAM/SPASM peptide maturase [Actinoplanes awajinensis]|uniref:FxsB family radical SAM/SPASM domain protein n=1 Tax=Actinoplanes awajinensis subsp. mycoplanecinus TaxID=135947 RepID=A0A0X3VCD6_9ACTN|nr:FxsB family cyclophane-forming radical SAM/SPASM peptide maturase [Actinoplanes awajinensis]KUL42405.1 FxsB family radical SAM/SPASM domain protein [Actinoplanes awajinensis subsp. mycoplanecinus]